MKRRTLISELCSLFLLVMIAQGQYKLLDRSQISHIQLSGNLQYDITMHINNNEYLGVFDTSNIHVYENRYSPLRAGLFSAVIPGAGQFYTKSYWQSAAFFGAEVLTWVVYAAYQNKGDQQTDLFQNYANEHWSVLRYALWIKDNYGQDYNGCILPGNIVDWGELNACEDKISQHTESTGFTHKLAPYGDQQYYEMIGKYSQFGGGWDDAAAFKTGGFTKEDVLANNGLGNVSPRFLEYRDMREKANSYYNIATTVSFVIVANHVLSALEAAWNASSINHKIQLQGHIQSRTIYGNFVEFVPTFHIIYEL